VFHALSSKVVVARDRLPADVAHVSTAVAASDFVAAILYKNNTINTNAWSTLHSHAEASARTCFVVYLIEYILYGL
jgi:hypothetical protein